MKKQNLNSKKTSSMIITNLVRIALILTYIRGWIMKDHSQDFLIILTFIMTYYPSVLEKRFGVYLPNGLQVIITLFIFGITLFYIIEIGQVVENHSTSFKN